MARTVALHNPGMMSVEELNQTFVGREALLDEVVAELREQAAKPVNQSILIIGPRGIGKTNFVHMIRNRVLEDEGLRAAYAPLLLPEENYSVTSTRDLFCRILDGLVEETGSEPATSVQAGLQDERDDERARELAIDALRDYQKAAGRKLLVFIENLDLVLGDQITDDTDLARLRDVLMNDGFLALIATSPTHFRQVSSYDRPLYNFFKLISLDELSGEEAEDLLRRRAEWENNRDFLSHFDDYRKRLPAIRHLTGGNPRLILMLYTVFCQQALVEVRAALEALLDELTPYYKARIERLSPQQRKVLDVFAREGHALTPTELGQATNLSAGQVSAVLGRLSEDGFVELAEQKRRKQRLYIVSERMFRIWHQMRMSPTSRRLQYFIEFIGIWYSAEEAREEAGRLLAGLLADIAQGERGRASGKAECLSYLAAGVGDPSAAYEIADEAIAACIKTGQCEEAEGLVEGALARARREGAPGQVAHAHFMMAWLRDSQGRPQEAMEALASCVAADPTHHQALLNWGVALGRLADRSPGEEARLLLEQACEKLAEAVRVKPGKHEAPYNWGVTLQRLADRSPDEEARLLLKQACERFAEAVRVKPDMHEALLNWGVALGKLADRSPDEEARLLLKEACERFAEAVRVKPDKHEALSNWAGALGRLAQLSPGVEGRLLLTQACEKCVEAVRVKPDKHEALYNWGVALARLAARSSDEEAGLLLEQACVKYAEAVRVKPDKHDALCNWGVALAGLAARSPDEEARLLLNQACEKYAEAIRVKPDLHEALASWASGLLGLAAKQTPEERGGTVTEAAAKAREALAQTPTAAHPNVPGYLSVLGRACMAQAGIAAARGDLSTARAALAEGVASLDVDTEARRRALVGLFRRGLSEGTAGFFSWVMGLLRDRGLGEDVEVLAPFQAAIAYWQQGREAKVLERLNPEVREIVEEIIRRGEQKEEAGTPPEDG